MALKIHVNSPNVKYTNECIEANYEYQTTKVTKMDDDDKIVKYMVRNLFEPRVGGTILNVIKQIIIPLFLFFSFC